MTNQILIQALTVYGMMLFGELSHSQVARPPEVNNLESRRQEVLDRAKSRLERARRARASGQFSRSQAISTRTLVGLEKLDSQPADQSPQSQSQRQRETKVQIAQQANALIGKTDGRRDRFKEDVIDKRRVKIARNRLDRARAALKRGDREGAQKIISAALEGINKIAGLNEGTATPRPTDERNFILRAAAQMKHQLVQLDERLNPNRAPSSTTFPEQNAGSVEQGASSSEQNVGSTDSASVYSDYVQDQTPSNDSETNRPTDEALIFSPNTEPVAAAPTPIESIVAVDGPAASEAKP